MLFPLSWNCTLTTPILSEANTLGTMVPRTGPPPGFVSRTVGGVVSDELLTVTVSPLNVVVFPAMSLTTADRV